MVNRKLFAERLVHLRTQQNLMAKDVAKYLKITKQSMSVYELGKGLPSADKLTEIADFFNISIDYLVGRSDDPKLHFPHQKHKDATQKE